LSANIFSDYRPAFAIVLFGFGYLMKTMICAFVCLLPFLASADGADDPWKPVRFIIGDWIGDGSGKPGEGTGEFSLKPDLGGRILVRRNHNEYPAQAGRPNGLTHDDLMIIYPAQRAGPFRAEYFDSEGHVIHYVVSCSEGKAVFLSDNPPDATRFRLTYQRKGGDKLVIDLEIAQANQDFRPYLTGVVTRK
jgi:hypothetical protein